MNPYFDILHYFIPPNTFKVTNIENSMFLVNTPVAIPKMKIMSKNNFLFAGVLKIVCTLGTCV